ncbi:MAG: hypothetical protein A2114_02520 [Candidatus Vogelbacteria bacterium GWA1_51_14]|uniref:Primosomal protein N' 3' DNA-binding domain-containing protein n=1 Tax=Candidatus Vogelbacteria bacterium GWA1_51_14 TaxID=1802435 RepID=A0A1G2QB63_9BACT|nr:MAG: hypothetical protein A2114_02520 [Candidatus Vogelbacteria bacterium GWA1_51_14]
MQIIEVTPISKGIWSESLTYFTKDPVAAGSIVSVPIRAKNTPALVIKSTPATDLKSALRQADFKIKKAGHLLQANLLLPGFLEAAKATATYFGSPLGPVLDALIPKPVIDLNQSTPVISSSPSDGLKIEHGVLQGPDEERYSFYKSLIRESFARGHSVFLILPTIADIEIIAPALEKGINDFTITIHSQLTKKELTGKFKQIKTDNHPILIIGTPAFLALVRSDVKTIIVERENSSAYKDLKRPFLDYRIFAQLLGEQIGAKVIIGDLALRSETIFKLEQGALAPLAPIKYRAFTELDQELIDSTQSEAADGWQPLSVKFIDRVSEALQFGDRVMIIAGRRGLAPITICDDCGTVKSCPTCSATLILHEKTGAAVFRCHRCGLIESAEDKCRVCGGWRLRTLGAGIESLAKILKQHLPNQAFFQIDSDTTKTKKVAQAVASKFLRQPGSLLLGTEMTLNYIREPIETTAIAGFDSLLAIPDFRISEKLFLLLLRTRNLATKRFFLETRKPEEKTYRYALAGNLLDFYRDEIGERQKLGWPPFSVLIKLTVEGPPETAARLIQTAATELEAYEPAALTLPGSKPRTAREVLIIQRPADDWPDLRLAKRLSSLPPAISVDVEPESLF